MIRVALEALAGSGRVKEVEEDLGGSWRVLAGSRVHGGYHECAESFREGLQCFWGSFMVWEGLEGSKRAQEDLGGSRRVLVCLEDLGGSVRV